MAHVPLPLPRRQVGVRLKFPSKDIQLRGMSVGRSVAVGRNSEDDGEMCWSVGRPTN